MIRTDSGRGRIALAIAHCAGMVDMVALPLWVGVLIQHFRFDPQQSGLLVTLFLAGAVAASLLIAPLFHRLASGRMLATAGLAGGAVAFWMLASATDFGSIAMLHALGGFAIGIAQSVTQGTVARSANPHRLYAICGMALGVFALLYLGSMPPVIASMGGPILFKVFAAVMLVGAVVSLLSFPVPNEAPMAAVSIQSVGAQPSKGLWFGILGLCTMSVVQAMAFSFFERMGADSAFGVEKVTAVLIAMGFLNLFPTALAAFLEKRWSARTVLMVGPIVQAIMVASIFTATTYLPYAVPGALFVGVMLFTHVFGFGLLAQIDPTGRTLAGTPAMMMTGAAIGPILGGTLVKFAGYPAIGFAALALGGVAVACFARLPRPTRQRLAAANAI